MERPPAAIGGQADSDKAAQPSLESPASPEACQLSFNSLATSSVGEKGQGSHPFGQYCGTADQSAGCTAEKEASPHRSPSLFGAGLRDRLKETDGSIHGKAAKGLVDPEARSDIGHILSLHGKASVLPPCSSFLTALQAIQAATDLKRLCADLKHL